MNIETNWNTFKIKLKCFPKLFEDLNEGCKEIEIENIEMKIDIKFPLELRLLYLLNNGQKGKTDGIFKAVSGYSKFSKVKFLNLQKLLIVWQILKSYEELDVFDPTLIPFASDRDDDAIDDVYCIDSITEEIYLLWVATPDWTLPADWQTAKLKRANNLSEFIDKQLEMY